MVFFSFCKKSPVFHFTVQSMFKGVYWWRVHCILTQTVPVCTTMLVFLNVLVYFHSIVPSVRLAVQLPFFVFFQDFLYPLRKIDFFFIIYINKIKECFLHCNFLLYADDLKIFRKIRSVSDCYLLQNDLDRVSDFCNQNGLFVK